MIMGIKMNYWLKKRFFTCAAVLLVIGLAGTGCSDTGRKTAGTLSEEQTLSDFETASSEYTVSFGNSSSSAASKDTAGSPSKGETDPGTSSGQPSAAEFKPLKVDGTRLTTADGKPIVLKGISTHGLSWFPEYVNADSIKQLHSQWGANCIRLAMYTAESNGYCTGGAQNQAKLKRLIDDGVKYATQNQMYVIIDWHILSDNNPNIYLNQAKQFFSEMAEKYAAHHNVLYEICNEPNGGTSWAQIKSYAQQIIPVIRQKDSDAVIIVGTPNWCQYLGEAAADPITEYGNIMYALHFYAATHTDSLRQEMVSALRSGLPVFVSEFGICDASGNGRIDAAQASKWMNLLDQHGISRIAWNLSNKNETSAIIAGSCQKKSGWSYQDLSTSGKWLLDNMFHKNASSLPGTSSLSSHAAVSSSAAPSQNSSGGRLDNAPYKLTVTNSWEDQGKKYQQYELTVLNTHEKNFTGWSVTITFDAPMTLMTSWNGEYAMSGNKLTVRSLDYNEAVPALGQVTGIGFIVHN